MKSFNLVMRHLKNLEVDYYVCQIYGNTVEVNVPEKCPICGAKKSAFKKIV